MADGGVVLVTGATGAIGPALVDELVRSGYRVRTLSRRAPDGALPAGVESQRGDITDRDAVERAVDGTAAIFHLAARLHLAGPPSRDMGVYQRVNVNGDGNRHRRRATSGRAASRSGQHDRRVRRDHASCAASDRVDDATTGDAVCVDETSGGRDRSIRGRDVGRAARHRVAAGGRLRASGERQLPRPGRGAGVQPLRADRQRPKPAN